MIDAPQSSTGEIPIVSSALWRFRAGVVIFAFGFGAPLLIPLVMASDLPTAWKSTLAGALAVGVPEGMMIAAAAVMGKEGFSELKHRLRRFFRTHGPPQRVGRARYRVGLAMFALPVLAGWIEPYLLHLLPARGRFPLWWHLGGDLLFVASLLVLGAEFWDKLRALFMHGARASLPDSADHLGMNR